VTGTRPASGPIVRADDCPTPGKVKYPTRAAAARVRRKRGWLKTRPYRCPCGTWHLGHLANDVVKGDMSRKEAHGLERPRAEARAEAGVQ
jgi:hypothetical protein